MKITRPYLADARPRLEEPPAPPAPAPAPRPHPFVTRVAEAGFAVLLTLVCFFALLIVMSRALPSATDLGGLFSTGGPAANQTSGLASALMGPDLWKNISLVVLDNDVMRKGMNDIAWWPAGSGAVLTEGDGIQTTHEGMAVVAFDRNNHLRLGRNSLVILRRPETDLIHPHPAARLTAVSGELWGVFGSPNASIQVDVGAGRPAAQLSMGKTRDRSQFKISVGPDKSAAIAVYHGAAKLTVAGHEVSVQKDHVVVVDSTGHASAAARLLDPPAPDQPAAGLERVYREFPPTFQFGWQAVAGAQAYRLTIARDPDLVQAVVDERVNGLTYAVGGLTSGAYWWSVTAVRGNVDGRPSPPRRLTLIEDRVPPSLHVAFGDTRRGAESLTLEGTTEPGARVFVGGAPATVLADGAFNAHVALKPGLNLVVVEAVDAAGNTTYRSQEIQRVLDGGR